jgi:hypothetical protein
MKKREGMVLKNKRYSANKDHVNKEEIGVMDDFLSDLTYLDVEKFFEYAAGHVVILSVYYWEPSE